MFKSKPWMGRAVRAAILGLSLTALVFGQGTSHQGASPDLASLDLESLMNLDVTTASKFAEKLSEASGVMSVVTKDELQRFGGVTLREILERVSGLSGATAYFTDRSLVAARGDQTKIDGGHILILINGRPTREVLEGGIISDVLESFPINILEKIEVVKGPGSVLYGSNAFSAVINLITERPGHDGFAFNGFGGAGGALGTTGEATFKRGDLGIIGAAQFHQKSDWNTLYKYWNPVSGAVSSQNITIGDRGPGAYLGVNYKGFNFMSSSTQWETSYFVRGTAGKNRWRRGFADLGYALKATRKWDMSFNLTYTRTQLYAFAFPNIDRDSNEVTLEWTNSVRVAGKTQVTFGSLYNHIQGREVYFGAPPNLTISEGGRPGGAAYGQIEHRLRNDLKLIGGVQANKIGNIDLNAVPRAGIVWDPTSHLTAKVLYSEAFRAPSINETRLNHPNGLKGNPNLYPEKVGTVDIGVSYQGNRAQLGINYFRSRQTDSIVVLVIDPSTNLRRYSNLGEATFHGVETEGKYYLKRDFFLNGSVAYQGNNDGFGTKDITPVPNIISKAGVSYESQRGVTASFFDVSQGPVHGHAGVNPGTGSYGLLNTHLRFDVSRYLARKGAEGLAFFVHGDNLANKQVWLPEWGGNAADSIPVQHGRTIYFGLEVSLKKE